MPRSEPTKPNGGERDGMTAPPPRDGWLVAGSGAGALGGALAAGFAGLCCVGSVSVALLGVGGALAASQLTPYRPVLLLVAAALLAFGFWRAYGRRVVGGGSCPVRAGPTARAMLWIGAAAWVAAAVLPSG